MRVTELIDGTKDTSFHFKDEVLGRNYLLAATFYDAFGFHVVAVVPTKELMETSITDIIIQGSSDRISGNPSFRDHYFNDYNPPGAQIAAKYRSK